MRLKFTFLFLFLFCPPGAQADDIHAALAAIGCLESAHLPGKLKVRTAIRCYQKSINAKTTGTLTPAQQTALLDAAAEGTTVERSNRYALPAPSWPTVLVGGDFRQQDARELWGDVCVADSYLGTTAGRLPMKDGRASERLQTLNFGYRYNPLIVARRGLAAANHDYIRNYPDRFSPSTRETARLRAAWASEDNLDKLAGELPFFWRLRNRNEGELVFFAPTGSDPHGTCSNGHIRRMSTQYALFQGVAGPRVHGDLCAPVPTIIFGRSNYRNLRLTEVFDSALLLGWDIPLARVAALRSDDYSRDGFLDTLRKVMAIHEIQCGRPLLEADVVFEEQVAAFHIGVDTDIRPTEHMRPALRGFLRRTEDDRLVFDIVLKSETALGAEKNAAREREVRRRLAAYRASLGQRVALGSLLVFGGAAYLQSTVFNDCNRPLLPDDPPRPLYCALD